MNLLCKKDPAHNISFTSVNTTETRAFAIDPVVRESGPYFYNIQRPKFNKYSSFHSRSQ